jgi:HPt (histidine-containing phosphotransfer) domain-containing protein
MDAFLTKPVELAALVNALAVAPAPAPDRHARLRAELAARFRTAARAEAGAVQAALGRRDWAELKRRAHHLKSSAGVVGDERLYTACTAIEDAAEAADADVADRAWPECEAALAPWLTRDDPR